MKEREIFDWGPWIRSFIIPGVFLIGACFVARADIGNLQDRVSKLENLPETVSSMKADLQSMKDQQTEMRQDIKTLLQRVR